MGVEEVIIHQEDPSSHLHLWVMPVQVWMKRDCFNPPIPRIRVEHMKTIMNMLSNE